MTTGFHRTESDRMVVRLDEPEKALIRSLAEQIIGFVAPSDDAEADPLARMVGIDARAEQPADLALARLLPNAYLDDDEAAGDFRRFTERSLRETKVAHARAVLDAVARSGEKITLSPDECASWLGFLNDARLAIGTRIEVTEENHTELAALPDDDPRGGMFQVYDWLTYLQDSLVEVMLA